MKGFSAQITALARLLVLVAGLLVAVGLAPLSAAFAQSDAGASASPPAAPARPAAKNADAQPFAPDKVTFPSLDSGRTELTAWLLRPPGEEPRPAVVMMHGCSGLINPRGRMTALYRVWMRALHARGYVVLNVDSASSRGFGQTCSAGPQRRTMWRDRSKDAYGALLWLQAQPFVRADRVAVMGWSQGGGAVLLSIAEPSIGRPPGLTSDFAAAVAFYPGACNDVFQSKPWTAVEPNGWTTKTPLLVLFGAADTWTPLPPCEAFLNGAKARGVAVELVTYPDAAHAFDAPNVPRIELPQYREGDRPTPVIETNRAARADVFRRVPAFLEAQLKRQQ
jgi:dienelactone hydrolase